MRRSTSSECKEVENIFKIPPHWSRERCEKASSFFLMRDIGDVNEKTFLGSFRFEVKRLSSHANARKQTSSYFKFNKRVLGSHKLWAQMMKGIIISHFSCLMTQIFVRKGAARIYIFRFSEKALSKSRLSGWSRCTRCLCKDAALFMLTRRKFAVIYKICCYGAACLPNKERREQPLVSRDTRLFFISACEKPEESAEI